MLVKHLVQKSLLFKNAGALSRAAYHAHHPAPTMNDLPVPSGDWKEAHARANTKYNAVLLAGILVLAGTIGFAKTSGLIELNSSPPASLD